MPIRTKQQAPEKQEYLEHLENLEKIKKEEKAIEKASKKLVPAQKIESVLRKQTNWKNL